MRLLASLSGHAGAVAAVAFAPDGKTLATGSEDDTVKLWSLAAGQEVATLKGHTGALTSLAFAPNGNTLASASDDKTVRLWRAIPFAETDGSPGEAAAGSVERTDTEAGTLPRRPLPAYNRSYRTEEVRQ